MNIKERDLLSVSLYSSLSWILMLSGFKNRFMCFWDWNYIKLLFGFWLKYAKIVDCSFVLLWHYLLWGSPQ